jgi:hypothetical protein
MTIKTISITAFLGLFLSACALASPEAGEAGPDAGAGASGDDDVSPGENVPADPVTDPVDPADPVCDDASGATTCGCSPGYLTCDDGCVPASGAAYTTDGFTPDRPCGTIGSCYGQTFVAPADGWLTTVRHASVSSQETMLQVYIGGATGCQPEGELLAQQRLDAGGEPMQPIPLTKPLRVYGGREYTVKFVGDDSGWIHTCEINDSYQQGHALANMNWDIGFEVMVASCP